MRKFELGQVCMTVGVADLAETNATFDLFVDDAMTRYINEDWGDLTPEDRKQNDDAVKYGERIMGVYEHPKIKGWTIWIITEWDRSVTTILLPEEY